MQIILFVFLSFLGLCVLAAGLMAKDVPMEPTGKPTHQTRREILSKLEKWLLYRRECLCGECIEGFCMAPNVEDGKCRRCQERIN